MVKTSELIQKLALASENSCKCEDENFNRVFTETFKGKSKNDMVSIEDMIKVARVITDYSRFTSIRTTCKVLQELGVAENDINVFDNDAFRSELAKAFHVE